MLQGKCLLCFTVNKQTFDIFNTHLQQLLEKLVDSKIEIEPHCLCFICHKRLQQCYQLMKLAKTSHYYLKTMLTENVDINLKVHHPLLNMTKSKMVNISFPQYFFNIETDVKVKKEYFDVDESEPQENIDESLECTQGENDDPLKDITSEHCYLKNEPTWIKPEGKEVSIGYKDTANPTELKKTRNVSSKVPKKPRRISLRPRPSRSSRVSDNNILNFPNDNSSEFDDSDRDATYNPVSEDSSSVTSYTEEMDQVLNDTYQNQQLSLGLRRLEKSQDLTTSNNEHNNDNGIKLKRMRTKDYCFFCELDVLNFARHISRKHSMEPEVQKIMTYPKKSFTRKNLLTELRKKGNYIKNVVKCDKPMKKSRFPVDYLPCEKCLGFYARRQLWKHKKVCQPSSQTANAQVEAQNFMLRNLNIDKKLKDEVFPKMRPDRISLHAKRDMLICALGAQYVRIHREKHSVSVISRKMRELAKLVLELKMLKPSLNNLMDCLKVSEK